VNVATSIVKIISLDKKLLITSLDTFF